MLNINKIKNFPARKLKQIKRKIKIAKINFAGNSQKRWYGSEYGGFYVREEVLNPKKDLLIYSIGVGKDISFDKKIAAKYKNAKILLFDPTPISIDWIKTKKLPANFSFYPVGVSSQNRTEKMYFPKNHVASYTVFGEQDDAKDEILVNMQTIESIAEEHGHTEIDILKMDIEGSEFEVLNTLNFNKLSFGQILVEFHERFIENGEEVLANTIARLEENGYECFAISDGYEYSFVNTSFSKAGQ